MRIIYILFSFQHPGVRGSDRHYHFIRELSKWHKITLLAQANFDIPSNALEEMRAYTEDIILFDSRKAAVPPVASVNTRIKRLWQHHVTLRAMRQKLDQMAREKTYDLVLFHGKKIFPVIENFSALPLAVDFCDATSMRLKTELELGRGTKRPIKALRYLHYRRIEKKLVGMTRHLAFITGRDRAAILGDSTPAQVIPNGIDLQYWTRRTGQPNANRLIFTGVMDYQPNEDAALYLINEVLPLLRKQIPGVEIVLAGRSPTERLRQQAAQHPEVTVTGFVDDMRDYLEQAALFVAPLRFASGMQNKLQEAMAMELPVITTSLGAAGLTTENGIPAPLYVADDPQAFASRIVELIGNQAERSRLACEGRRFAETYFVWPHSAEKLDRLCQEAFLSKNQ